MEPKKNPIKSRDSMEALRPLASCPADIDDYFELACEADEFGIHVPDDSAENSV
jgi:hypothetical protein